MSLSRQLANDQIKKRVRRILPDFVSDVDPDQLCDHLIAKDIITIERWNEIRTEKTTQQQRCRELLFYLFSISNPRTFPLVRETVEKICPHIYDQIERQSDTETDEGRPVTGKRKRTSDESIPVAKLIKSSVINSSGIFKIDKKPSSFITAGVVGVAKMNKRIYVLVRDRNSGMHALSVFKERKPFTHVKPNIRLKEIASGSQLLSSEKLKCLYISQWDKTNLRIWKCCPTADGSRVIKWLSTEDRVDLCCISVSNDGHVLVLTGCKTKDMRKLEIYDGSEVSAMLFHSVPLPLEIKDPRWAIQKPNGKIAIVHMLDCGKQPIITQLKSDGQIAEKFKLRLESEEEMCTPLEICLDARSSRLFVLCNDGVYMFDSNSFRFLETITDDSWYGSPRFMCYDERDNQLTVSFKDKPILEVFRLNYRKLASRN